MRGGQIEVEGINDERQGEGAQHLILDELRHRMSLIILVVVTRLSRDITRAPGAARSKKVCSALTKVKVRRKA